MGGKKEEGFKPLRGHGDEGRPHPYTVSGNQPRAAPGIWHPCPVDEESAGSSPYKYWNEDALSRWPGHPGQHPHLGVGRQWCQSQLGDASLCLPTQPGGASDLRVGSLPQSLLGPHSTSRAGRWMGGATGLHLDEGPDRSDAPLQ